MAEKAEYIIVNNRAVKRLPDYPQKKHLFEGQDVFIIGSKGIPALYGGFETFAEKLTQYRISDELHYHVARIAADNVRYEYNNAECFSIKVPRIGAARAVWYDMAALAECIRWCRRNPGVKQPVFYILACRIGPVIGWFKKRIEEVGGILYLNPDGHEWKRRKWNRLIRSYWKLSEKLMVKHADYIICDSLCIKKYIQKEYTRYNPRAAFIAYGSDNHEPSVLSDTKGAYADWLKKHKLQAGEYYLTVSRFVPENNFEFMIREFMDSDSPRDFVIITTKNPKFYNKLEKKLHFSGDKRIKFADTVYDSELLKKIRENACGYMHGHEVGGTNPSLLEALESTDINLLFDVEFNREVAEEAAFYWTKKKGDLAALITKVDGMNQDKIHETGMLAKKRIAESYKWEDIVKKYESAFLKHNIEGI